MKEEFLKCIKDIKNDTLRKVAIKMMDDAPDYFWTVAASSTGKYHPEISLGEGGLVRHSIMAWVIAQDLLKAEIFVPYSDDNKDIVSITILFHDIIKRGNNESSHTAFDHPILSAEFVRKHLNEAEIDENITNIICNAIAHHMGKWTTCNYSNIVLEPPSTNFERLIHTADYIASRKYIKGLEHWNK